MLLEYCILLTIVAAAAIAYAALPQRKTPARTFLYAGTLAGAEDWGSPEAQAQAAAPGIVAECLNDGTLSINRFGLSGIRQSGAFSLSVTVTGFNVAIEERLLPGNPHGPEMTRANAVIDCLALERYHFRYHSERDRGLSCAFQLNIKPGNIIRRPLAI